MRPKAQGVLREPSASLCVEVAAGKEPAHIITTNFDLLLERALLRAEEVREGDAGMPQPRARAVTDASTTSDRITRSWVVHHLHG